MEAAAALLRGGPSAEDLKVAALFGFTAADYANEPPFEVWPCCWPAVMVFADCAGSPIFPRTLTEVMDLRAVPAEERPAVFDDMLVMESEVRRIHKEQRARSDH